MKTAIVTLLIGSSTWAQTPMTSVTKSQAPEEKPNLVEVVCRIKAKEAAAHAFRSCLLDDKAAQVQELKKSAGQRVQKRRQLKSQNSQIPQIPKAPQSPQASQSRGTHVTTGSIATAAPASPSATEKTEVYRDAQTRIEIQTEKELDTALELIEKPKKTRLKPAMLVEDDTEIPEPTVLEEDVE